MYGKEKRLSLGVYPDVPLQQARRRRDENRTLISNGTNPSEHRHLVKQTQADSFKVVSEEWLALQEKKLSAVTLSKAK
jgi:hypothetical protein